MECRYVPKAIKAGEDFLNARFNIDLHAHRMKMALRKELECEELSDLCIFNI